MKKLVIIAGPCVIQSKSLAKEISTHCKKICDDYNVEYIFKGSFKKANRTKINSFTSIGEEKALKIIQEVGEDLGIETLTDIHESNDAKKVSHYVDIAQIPAFLCRQTDLIVNASMYFSSINIKKGQWMSHQNMIFAKEKCFSKNSITSRVFLTERGNVFGYNNLIIDFPRIKEMKTKNSEVIVDCTHATQVINNQEGVSSGNARNVSCLAKCAIVSGASGIFVEVHPDPISSPSDALSMLPLDKFENLVSNVASLYKISENLK